MPTSKSVLNRYSYKSFDETQISIHEEFTNLLMKSRYLFTRSLHLNKVYYDCMSLIQCRSTKRKYHEQKTYVTCFSEGLVKADEVKCQRTLAASWYKHNYLYEVLQDLIVKVLMLHYHNVFSITLFIIKRNYLCLWSLGDWLKYAETHMICP